MRLRHILALLLAASAVLRATAAPETWQIDPNHSALTFKVRHFLAPVPGWFAKFSGTIIFDRTQPEASRVEATVDIASVNTNQADRDQHLRTPDFFDTASHPTATFRSKAWKQTGPDTFEVTGDLTLRGVTREVTLRVKHLGYADGNRGAKLSGWEAVTTLRRADFGIGKPERSIGDEVEVTIHTEAKLQK